MVPLFKDITRYAHLPSVKLAATKQFLRVQVPKNHLLTQKLYYNS